MTKSVRWRILSSAKITLTQVIPATQQPRQCQVVATSSSNIEKAKEAASNINIQTAYASYEELLADPTIDAIFESSRQNNRQSV